MAILRDSARRRAIRHCAWDIHERRREAFRSEGNGAEATPACCFARAERFFDGASIYTDLYRRPTNPQEPSHDD